MRHRRRLTHTRVTHARIYTAFRQRRCADLICRLQTKRRLKPRVHLSQLPRPVRSCASQQGCEFGLRVGVTYLGERVSRCCECAAARVVCGVEDVVAAFGGAEGGFFAEVEVGMVGCVVHAGCVAELRAGGVKVIVCHDVWRWAVAHPENGASVVCTERCASAESSGLVVAGGKRQPNGIA